MKITYISDQFLPSSSADTEQFINMLSALSKQSDAELISASFSKYPGHREAFICIQSSFEAQK